MNNNFDIVYTELYDRLSNKSFKMEKSDNSALFFHKNYVYKVEYSAKDNIICLEKKENNSNDQLEDWGRLSAWSFEEITNKKDIRLICDDFIQTMCNSNNTLIGKAKSKKILSDSSSDALFFANRMINIFPELRNEILIEKECYSDFRGVEFVKNNILPKILELLTENKDIKRIEKLFKFLNDLYKNSSLNIKSLITMAILNNIVDLKGIELAKKYLDNNLTKAWSASMKFKNKKIKPEKVKLTDRLLINSFHK